MKIKKDAKMIKDFLIPILTNSLHFPTLGLYFYAFFHTVPFPQKEKEFSSVHDFLSCRSLVTVQTHKFCSPTCRIL